MLALKEPARWLCEKRTTRQKWPAGNRLGEKERLRVPRRPIRDGDESLSVAHAGIIRQPRQQHLCKPEARQPSGRRSRLPLKYILRRACRPHNSKLRQE